MKRFFGFACLLLAVTFGFAVNAQESVDDYPSKPITWIVPFPPGGGATIVARAVQEPLAQELGQPIVIVNRPGASGAIGAVEVARAEPDGYTMVVLTTQHIVAPAVQSNLPYDPLKDFEPITSLSENSSILVVHPSVKATNLQEFIDLMKAEPGKYRIGHDGIGSVNHLLPELMRSLTGVEFTFIPYQGGGPVMNDLLAGNVDAMFGSPEPLLPHIQSGSIRALGVAATKLMDRAPEIPLLSDTVPGLVNLSFSALAAPKGTPKPILEKVSAAVRKVFEQPDLKKTMYSSDVGRTPDDLTAMMTGELEKWRKVAKETGVTINP